MPDQSKPDSSRAHFEAFIRERTPEGYKEYLRVKKRAIETGEDPIRAFRELVRTSLGENASVRFWLKAVGKRIVVPEQEDIAFLRNVLLERHLDLDQIADLLSSDRKKIADIICAMNLDKLTSVDYSAIYLIVDKLVTGKKSATSPKIPLGRINLFDTIPEEILLGNADAYELLKKYTIDYYQEQFDINYSSAQKQLNEQIELCPDHTKKALLGEVSKYFDELAQLQIPDIISEVFDPSSDQFVPFPALHQKIGAKFVDTQKRVLIADAMGLGKTAQAVIAKNLIDQSRTKPATAVVVVPNSILSQWEVQIQRWNKKRKKIVILRSQNKEETLEKIESEKPDFVIVSYGLIFRKSGDKTVGERLCAVSDYLILDEVHNAAAAKSLRSTEVVKLSKHSEYVVLLSGTPVTNSIEDLGVIASILSEHKFTPEEFNREYGNNPRIVRQAILPQMLRRRKSGAFGKRECEVHVVPVQMTIDQATRHKQLELNSDDLGALELIMQLRKCALDPKLVGLDDESVKYDELLSMLRNHYDGSPAVVFSSELKEGILDKLYEKIASDGYRVARIDGDAERSGTKRDKILQEFSEGKYDVLVATLSTLGEGVDKLTIAHRAYFIDVPFNEAKLSQGITRLDRQGQKSNVDIYILLAKDSIDELLFDLIEQKRRLSEFLVDGMELTDNEKAVIDGGSALVTASVDPLRKIYRFFGNITNKPASDILRLLADPTISDYVAKEYYDNFDGSFYGNTATLIKQVVSGLEAAGRKFDKIIDVASGPCCLARVLERQVVSLDANFAALKLGKRNLGENARDTVLGSFTIMPFKPSFDMAVFSLALLHSAANEREKILRELNHCMKKDGVLIITTPDSEGRYEKLAKVLPILGFKLLPQITGSVDSKDNSTFDCMILCAVKVGEPQEMPLPPELFDFSSEQTSEGEGEFSKTITRKPCASFEINSVPVEQCLGIQKSEPATKEVKITIDGIDKNIVDGLIAKYGDLKSAFEKLTPKDAEELGIVIKKKGGRNPVYVVSPRLTGEMKERYDASVALKKKDTISKPKVIL